MSPTMCKQTDNRDEVPDAYSEKTTQDEMPCTQLTPSQNEGCALHVLLHLGHPLA